MTWFDWILIVWFATNALTSIGMIGKQRHPIEPLEAVILTIFCGLMIAGVAIVR